MAGVQQPSERRLDFVATLLERLRAIEVRRRAAAEHLFGRALAEKSPPALALGD